MYISVQIHWKIPLHLNSKNTLTSLLDLDCFFDILGLDLKEIWTNLLDSDWFYYNQAGMLLKKYKMFSKFDFPRSGYVWYVKHQTLMLSVAKLGIFLFQQELRKSKSNINSFILSEKRPREGPKCTLHHLQEISIWYLKWITQYI